MLILAIILAIVGLSFLVGPTLLSMLLVFGAALDPVSLMTTITLIVFVVVEMILHRKYRKLLKKMVDARKHGGAAMRNVYKSKENMDSAYLILRVLEILSIIIILLNKPLTVARDVWEAYMMEKETMLIVLRYVGGVLTALAVGFFLGRRYIMKSEEEEEQEEEDDCPPDPEYRNRDRR